MIEDIRACVAEEFAQVNTLIVEQLHSNVDMVENIGQYIVDGGGKRLRPMLVLLTAKALGAVMPDHIKFAAVVEFIHTATLLHDDVVDLSAMRRGRPTASHVYGNAPAVLVGDFIYTRAFQLMVQLNSMSLLQHMADTTNSIAEGEVLQLVRAGDANTTEDQYREVIERKTAVLFAAACRGAALLGGGSSHRQQVCQQFGQHLGTAFQMIDDVLDYTGDPAVTGKNVGDDLSEGKATLPLIHVIAEGSSSDAQLVRDAIEQKSTENLAEVIAAVHRTSSVFYTRDQAHKHRDLALEALSDLKPSPGRDALEKLTALSINRDK